jgi:hypothetical protein
LKVVAIYGITILVSEFVERCLLLFIVRSS